MSGDNPAVFRRLPNGFREVSVTFTEAEYLRLRHEAYLTPDGTCSAAIRSRLDLPQTPYGFKAALRSQLND